MTEVTAQAPDPADNTLITGAMLDYGLGHLDPEAAGVARVLAGLGPHPLFDPNNAYPGVEEFVAWRVGRNLAYAIEDGAYLATSPEYQWLRTPAMRDQEGPRFARPRLLRLVVEGNVVANEVIPRLLACPRVASAVLASGPGAGAIAGREWTWPMRLGVYDAALRDAVQEEERRRGVLPRELLSVTDAAHDPTAVGLLVASGSLRDVEEALGRDPRVANAVLVLGGPTEPWVVKSARLAVIRALTGASVVAMAASEDVATALLLTLRELSHGLPLDVALTAAFDRQVIVTGELEALDASALPTLIRRQAQVYRSQLSTAEPRLQANLVVDIDHFESLSDGWFDFERNEASEADRASRVIEEQLSDAEPDRTLQSYVAPLRWPGDEPDNRLVAGANELRVFIGPEEAGALAGLPVPQEALGFGDLSLPRTRVTLTMIPVEPKGDPVTTHLDVPRVGRSPDAVLPLPLLGEQSSRLEARLVLLHRNRVLQTGLLTGALDGEPVRFTERLSFWGSFDRLEDRQIFDHAFVLNHDESGHHGIHSFANDHCETIEPTPEVARIAGRIRNRLIEAAGARTKAARTNVFIHLARQGYNLYRELSGYFEALHDPHRIQVVTARSSWFLPIEFIYDRSAPVDGATLCGNWVARRPCGPQCFASAEDNTIVCPSVFWGMTRVIERHYVKADSKTGAMVYVGGASPPSTRTPLLVTPAAVGASSKITEKNLEKALVALDGVEPAADWNAWVDSLKNDSRLLLTLMPHTDDEADTMEIAGVELEGALIEPPYVTGGHDDRFPVVVLFGCDTAGFERNPAGFESRFLQSKAAVVFATMTMLSVSQAPRLCAKLAQLLRDQGRGVETLGEFVARFRRESVQEGLLVGLSITALGNSDWTI